MHEITEKDFEELKPCPFCGGEHAKVIYVDYYNHWYVTCLICNARTDTHKKEDCAKAMWNKRAEKRL